MIPKDAKLTQLHLLYKNDLPEGFGVGLDEHFFIDNPEIKALLVKCSQMSIDEYKKQKTDRQRRTFVAGIVSQFNTACRWMHEHKAEPGIDEEFISMFVILLDDMSFLQSVGLFPNNNFNGPMWTWVKDDHEVK